MIVDRADSALRKYLAMADFNYGTVTLRRFNEPWWYSPIKTVWLDVDDAKWQGFLLEVVFYMKHDTSLNEIIVAMFPRAQWYHVAWETCNSASDVSIKPGKAENEFIYDYVHARI